jgi:hypothetical protein
VLSGKVGRRTRSFRIVVGASGLLHATLHFQRRPERAVELGLRRNGRSIVVVRGRVSLRLRVRVRRGTYRLVITSSGGRPAQFKLILTYPRVP